MIEWNAPQQAERFVTVYADPILRLCLSYSLSRDPCTSSKMQEP